MDNGAKHTLEIFQHEIKHCINLYDPWFIFKRTSLNSGEKNKLL